MNTLKLKSDSIQTKHKAWKGERVGLFIRVPVNVAEDLRNDAQKTQKHINDLAIERLQLKTK